MDRAPSRTDEPILNVKGVASGYQRGNEAISGIDLSVSAGQIVTVLGGNGAGKTTLLRTIAGVLRTLAGSVQFQGDDLSRLSVIKRIKRGVVLVPQGRQLFLGMSVRENVLMGGYSQRGHGELSAEARMRRLFESFPIIRDRKDQIAGSLSGGEQELVAVARGLMASPKLLLLDEPSLGLSPKMRKVIFGSFVDACRSGQVAMVIAEQDVRSALGIADHAYVLRTGRVAFEGKVDEAFKNDPRFLQAYLGAGQ